MAHQGNTGQPTKIAKLEGESGLRLDMDALRGLLLAERVKNLPVVVVSVAGNFRQGKSFLLNFFLRYMRNRTEDDWMGDPKAKLEGFSWRGGSERDTMGILMWNEVFVVPTTGGKQVAVIFLDTQGIFDGKSTMKYSAKIFALSLMASSVQIYNVSKQIGENDLQNLQLFTQYGKLALEKTGDKPFQKLIFLVRDWPYEYEWEYGFTGGKGHAQKLLWTDEEQALELKDVRKDIFASFKNIQCCLMPYPGKKVTSEKTFDGCLLDIEKDFKDHLRVLVSSVLHPNNLVVKKINDCDISCEELFYHLESYGNILNGDDLPEPQAMFEAVVNANNSTAVNRAMDEYRTAMEKVFHGDWPYVDPDTLEEHHKRVMASALELFNKLTKMGGEERSQPHKDKLKKMLHQMFESFSKRNEGERIKAEEKKIMDNARRRAKMIVEDAQAFAWRTQAAALVSHTAMMTAQIAGPGALANAAKTAAIGSLVYALGEHGSGLLKQLRTFAEDKKED